MVLDINPQAKKAGQTFLLDTRSMLDRIFHSWASQKLTVPVNNVTSEQHRENRRNVLLRHCRVGRVLLVAVLLTVGMGLHSVLRTLKYIRSSDPTPMNAGYTDLYLNEADPFKCFEEGSRWHRLATGNITSVSDVLEQDNPHPKLLLTYNTTTPPPRKIINKVLVNRADDAKDPPEQFTLPAWMLPFQFGLNGYMIDRSIYRARDVKYPKIKPSGKMEAIFRPMRTGNVVENPINAIVAFHMDCVMHMGVTPPVIGAELPSRTTLLNLIGQKTKAKFDEWGLDWAEFQNRIPGVAQLNVLSGLDKEIKVNQISWMQRKLEPLADWLCDKYGCLCVPPEVQRQKNLFMAFQYVLGNYPHKSDYFWVQNTKNEARALWHIGHDPSSKQPETVPITVSKQQCRFHWKYFDVWDDLTRRKAPMDQQLEGRVLKSMQQDPWFKKYRNTVKYAPLVKAKTRLKILLSVLRKCVSLFGEDHVFDDGTREEMLDDHNVILSAVEGEEKMTCMAKVDDGETTDRWCRGNVCRDRNRCMSVPASDFLYWDRT
eukprot:comp23805_c0_seq1/m.41406 comp23805_c0_seq1/g.41406  ORF comp23805_c0_seq1/g.41406 comp23805_c0_seq1/m.41406 type:complete len:542 (-) comp23805_c0_seq1:515-2140(-)